MAGFVREREDMVEHVALVVHEDERIAIIRTGAERAALLAAILVAIAPPASQAAFPYFLPHSEFVDPSPGREVTNANDPLRHQPPSCNPLFHSRHGARAPCRS